MKMAAKVKLRQPSLSRVKCAGVRQPDRAKHHALNNRSEMSEAAAALRNYRWPGNVRELRNAIERAAVLCRSDVVNSDDLPDSVFRGEADGSPAVPTSTLEQVEREYIMHVLGQSTTLEEAAVSLGINVTTLWRKRKRYHLE